MNSKKTRGVNILFITVTIIVPSLIKATPRLKPPHQKAQKSIPYQKKVNEFIHALSHNHLQKAKKIFESVPKNEQLQLLYLQAHDTNKNSALTAVLNPINPATLEYVIGLLQTTSDRLLRERAIKAHNKNKQSALDLTKKDSHVHKRLLDLIQPAASTSKTPLIPKAPTKVIKRNSPPSLAAAPRRLPQKNAPRTSSPPSTT